MILFGSIMNNMTLYWLLQCLYRQFSSTCGSGFSMTKKTTAIKRHQQELLALLKGINELLGIPHVPKLFDDQTEEAVESQKMMSIQEEQVIDGTID